MWLEDKMWLSVESSSLHIQSAQLCYKLGDVVFGEKVEKHKLIPLSHNLITPDTIPEFCIPPRILSLPETRRVETGLATPAIRVPPSGRGGQEEEEEESPDEPFSPHIIQVESVDESPQDGGSDEETTNADPHSRAAMSIPHLAKAQTCYGFCTLLESPHTRRKESLFHSGRNSFPLLLPRSSSGFCSKLSPSPSSFSSSPYSLSSLASRLSPRSCSLRWQGALDSDTATTSSTESSPFGSPRLARCPAKSSLFKTLSHELLLSRSLRKAAVSRNNSLSTDEGSSTDNSPNVLRRASETVAGGAYSLAPPAIFSMDLSLHKDRATQERMVPMGKDGNLRLCAQYCRDNQRLRVRLISVEGLYAPTADPKLIHCSVSLSLVPGKLQKQRSTVIKKSRNPIFNEDFFFDGVTEDDLSQRSVRFKVVNKMSTLKRDYPLGVCDLPLSSIVTL